MKNKFYIFLHSFIVTIGLFFIYGHYALFLINVFVLLFLAWKCGQQDV